MAPVEASSSERRELRSRAPGRLALLGALIFLAALFLDVVTAKIQIVMGRIPPIGLGDGSEFLLFLGASVLFVIGALQREHHECQKSNSFSPTSHPAQPSLSESQTGI